MELTRTGGRIRGGRSAALPEHAPPSVARVLGTSGQGLTFAMAKAYAPVLGERFADVRIHADDAAARSAEAVGARAYTVGSHVVFGRGQFAPGTAAGRRLLAHE